MKNPFFSYAQKLQARLDEIGMEIEETKKMIDPKFSNDFNEDLIRRLDLFKKQLSISVCHYIKPEHIS
jgi:hypothetical protein